MEDKCPWCKFNPYGCQYDRCDFKSVPYEKEAILERIRKEVAAIDAGKMAALSSDNPELQMGMMVDLIDKAKGIDIMSQRLVADFGMTMEQVKKAAPSEKLSWMDRARLAMAIRDAQSKERGRK